MHTYVCVDDLWMVDTLQHECVQHVSHVDIESAWNALRRQNMTFSKCQRFPSDKGVAEGRRHIRGHKNIGCGNHIEDDYYAIGGIMFASVIDKDRAHVSQPLVRQNSSTSISSPNECPVVIISAGVHETNVTRSDVAIKDQGWQGV
jgi:hypothetical protein